MEPLNLHEWPSCQVYGHAFEADEDNPNLYHCIDLDCDESYVDDAEPNEED